MELKDFAKRLEKIEQQNPNFGYVLHRGCGIDEIREFERRLGKPIPQSILTFWKHFDGLQTLNPYLTINKLNELKPDDKGLIHFATFNHTEKIYFLTNELNEAKEWSITNQVDDYKLTLTMSSFWSNKIWHWLIKQTVIWKDNYWIKD
jgi:hypothetical protein